MAPRYRTVGEIHEEVSQRFEVSRRTIERDLKDVVLEQYRDRLDVRTKDDGRPGIKALGYGWKSSRDAPHLGPLDPEHALTMQLAAELLRPLVPASFLRGIENDLRRARHVLNQTPTSTRQVLEHLKILPRSTARLPAVAGNDDTLAVLAEAIGAGRQVRIRYRSIGGDAVRDIEINASVLGLIFRFDSFYAVVLPESDGTAPAEAAVDDIPVHRIRRAVPIGAQARTPPGFSLERHAGSASFTRNRYDAALMKLGESIKLRLAFAARTARYIEERPFSADQVMRAMDDGRVLVTATVPNTRELLTELLSFMDDVEILGPKALRRYFSDLVERQCRRYDRAG
jgi:predicted DNA-binding transcriptional regulator YafY